MEEMIKNSDLVKYMKKVTDGHVKFGFTDRVKMIYRPYICPFNELITLVHKNDVIYDIGCGSGQFVSLVANFSKPRLIYGIEIEEKLIENARLLNKNNENTVFNFISYDGIHIPQEIGLANKVFLIDVLHHIPKERQISFLEDLWNLLKPGTQLIIKDIDGDSHLVLFNKLHDLVFAKEIGNEIGLKKITEILMSIGFLVRSSAKKNTYVYPHYTVIVEK